MKRLPRQQLLPDPYFDPLTWDPAVASTGVSWASGAIVAANNQAMYLPQIFPVRATLYALRFFAGNGTGNYDLGVYDASFNRIASTGSTAMTAAGVKTLTLPELAVTAGTMLYAALALSLTTGTILRAAFSPAWPMIQTGMVVEASALPLPDPATPVQNTLASLPIFVWGVR